MPCHAMQGGMLLKDIVIAAGRLPDLVVRVQARDCGELNATERWRFGMSARSVLDLVRISKYLW